MLSLSLSRRDIPSPLHHARHRAANNLHALQACRVYGRDDNVTWAGAAGVLCLTLIGVVS